METSVIARRLGTALLALGLLAGCGSADDTAAPADDRASEQTQEPSPSPSETGPVDFTEVALLSVTAAGGEVDYRATVLDDATAVSQFAAQFETASMGEQLTTAVREADVAEGQQLAAAVVSIGCDVPPGVSVQKLKRALAIVPLKVKSPLKECLAAVTTVALVAVDESAL